jgi:CRP-like cAMP-binding protein
MAPVDLPDVACLQLDRRNDLLSSLSAADLEPLLPGLRWMPMRLGDLLYEPGEPLRHAWFPVSAVVSLHHVMASGACAQTCSVGHEGVIGLPLFMGGATTPSAAVVSTSGHGWRLDPKVLLSEFARGGALQKVLLRSTQSLMAQISQTVACYRHHSVEQQLAGWLAATQDRMVSDDVVMTQELLASLLGVRRESITQAAGRLQVQGYIRYRRGHIAVLDAPGLRTSACECYGVVKAEMHRLAPPPRPVAA